MEKKMTQEFVTINVQRGKRSYTYRLSKDRYEVQVVQAEELLKDAGYIAPVERRELEGLLSKTDYLLYTNLERTKKRIQEFQEAEIPPLYDSRFDESHFPAIDFLIQFPTGIYQQRAAAAVRRKKQEIKGPGIIQPSTCRDIFAFRTLAFDGDTLSDYVIREFEDYGRTKDLKGLDSETIVKSDLLLLKYLEQALKHLAPGERSYTPFQEGSELKFLRKRFWHVDYDPGDRVRIAKDYSKRLEEGEAGLRVKTMLPRMKLFFPEILDNGYDLERTRLERVMRECSETGDYRGMPKIVLVDSKYGTQYIRELQGHVRAKSEELVAEDPLKIFEPLADMHQTMQIPSGLLYLEEFRSPITEKRIKVLSEMDDETFAAYFGSNHHRTASIGHRQHVGEGLLDTQFRSLLLDRYRVLK